jgi:sulfite reductase (NADPH) flavoprotein alpha-component
MPSLIPPNAPFTAEQRRWLDGLFAGLLGIQDDVTPLSGAQAAALLPGFVDGTSALVEDDGAPWHDPAIPLPDRMKLAEGRPLPRRMMAAMAQQDCGQCGYNCNEYAGALFSGAEKKLNLCAPGGKDTARILKQLYQELENGIPNTESAQPVEMPVPAEPGRSRDNPLSATFLSRRRLNKDGSEKETWHIELDLEESGLTYAVGDSLGIFPINDPALADAVLDALGAPADFPIGGRTLRDVLINNVALSPAPDMLFQLISYITGGERRKKAQALAEGRDPDGDATTLDVLAAIEKFSGIRPDPEALIEALDPLQPRVYSISSSLKSNPGRVSLTVDAVRYKVEKRLRLGVASTFLGNRTRPGDKVKVYVQKAMHFALPANPDKPIIMIGPGTGVAPFRAFLQERIATNAAGPNWLFFGHQRSDYDFFYKSEFDAMRKSGHLHRLTLAWSRDGNEKIYVQQRMRESGRDLWDWIAHGAHIYVCGDALRMAKDVEKALIDIVTEHGKRSPEDAARFVAELKKNDRYQADVY